MVTRGIEDWELHCKELEEKYSRYGNSLAADFVEYYKSRWEPFQRSLLPHEICWRLYDHRRFVEKSGLKYYLILGKPGYGKSTLSWCIAYFLDPQWNLKYCTGDLLTFVNIMDELPTTNAMRAVILDEPSVELMGNSKNGKNFSYVLGQARQQKLFLIYNTTDLGQIPSYIYRYISTLIWIQYPPAKFHYFEDLDDKLLFTLQMIKFEYPKYNWNTYGRFMRNPSVIHFYKNADHPCSQEELDIYLKNKAEDYKRSIARFKQNFTKIDRTKLAVEWYKQGMKTQEIAAKLSISRRQAQRLVEKWVRSDDIAPNNTS